MGANQTQSVAQDEHAVSLTEQSASAPLSPVKLEICRRIAQGATVRQLEKEDKFPCRETITAWRNTDATFDLAITRAYQAYGTHTADRVAEMSDDLANGHYKGMDAVSGARTAMDGYKWLASKFYPKMFSDRQDGPRSSVTVHAGQIQVVCSPEQRQAMIKAREQFLSNGEDTSTSTSMDIDAEVITSDNNSNVKSISVDAQALTQVEDSNAQE